ncbi:MAG TPA: c-type cytochrome [Blastocatellia bacterium]|nr:c-type cytochrome [Blastocatellia bacterium]
MRRSLGIATTALIAGIVWFLAPAAPSSMAATATAQSAARIFASKCAGCHAPDGTGNIAGTPNFTDAAWQAGVTDEQLTASITNGKGKVMPAWGKTLSSDQIKGLVAHIRSLKK